jgi:hypothetical protein
MAMQFEVSGILAQNVSTKIEADTEQDAVTQFRRLAEAGKLIVTQSRIVDTSITVEELFDVQD